MMDTKFYNLYIALPKDKQIWFQQPASPVMEGIIDLQLEMSFHFIYMLTLVMYGLMGSVLLFTERSTNFSSRVNHWTLLESIYSIIPMLTIICIYTPSFSLLYAMDEYPDTNVCVKVVGRQWYWHYEVTYDGYKHYSNVDKFMISKIWNMPNNQQTFLDINQHVFNRTSKMMTGLYDQIQNLKASWKKPNIDYMLIPSAIEQLQRQNPIFGNYPSLLLETNNTTNENLQAMINNLNKEWLAQTSNLFDAMTYTKKLYNTNLLSWTNLNNQINNFFNNHKWYMQLLFKNGMSPELVGKINFNNYIATQSSFMLPNWLQQSFKLLYLTQLSNLSSNTTSFHFPNVNSSAFLALKFTKVTHMYDLAIQQLAHNRSSKQMWMLYWSLKNQWEADRHSYLTSLPQITNYSFDSYCLADNSLQNKYITPTIILKNLFLNPTTANLTKIMPYLTLDSNKLNKMLLFKTFSLSRLLETSKALVIPTGVAVRALVTSSDVMHSWAIPSLGVKTDGMPGRINQVFFIAVKDGIYYGQCSELCGQYHFAMPIVLKSMPIYSCPTGCSSCNN